MATLDLNYYFPDLSVILYSLHYCDSCWHNKKLLYNEEISNHTTYVLSNGGGGYALAGLALF